MFVRRVIVEDQVDGEVGRHFGVDAFEKPKPFLVPMARRPLREDPFPRQ